VKTSLKMFTIVVVLFCSFACSSARAWECTTPGQIRVQVPPGTKGNGSGNGDGQVDTVEGITFQCQTPKTGDPSLSQKQKQKQSQTQNQSSNNSNNNSNQNSNQNTNNNSSNSTSSSTSNASNGGQQNAQETNIVTNVPRQVASAIAPETLPTSPCFKTYSGAGQTGTLGLSFGGGKVDKGCDDRETARLFAVAGNRLAFAKIMCQTPAAKRAKLTLSDCLQAVPAPPAPQPASVVPNPQPTIIIVPTPVSATPVAATAPIPAPVEETKTSLTDLGSFRVLRATSTGSCPTTRVALGSQGIAILDRAIKVSNDQLGAIILTGNVYTTAVATGYLKKHGVSKVMVHASDDQNGQVSVQVWSGVL